MNSQIIRRIIPIALACLLPMATLAQGKPGKHPGYMQALSDLRAARGLLQQQPGDSVVSADEKTAISEIDAAVSEIKQASIDDGKGVNDYPAVDIKETGSRLLKAMETLHKAHGDIDHEEDNPEVGKLRRQALDHIDRANVAADHAHSKWLQQVHH